MADLRNLDVRQLAALDAIATTGTFGRAAEKLGYTQGAVSQQIAALERMVGAPIFDRPGGPRPPMLTPLGAVLLNRSRDLLARIDALGEEVDRVRDGRAGVLGLGAFQSVSAVVLPRVLAQMRKRFPNLGYRIVNADDDDELLAALESGAADIAFTGAATADISAEPILADPWVLLAEPGKFANGRVAVADLSGQPLIGQRTDAWQRQSERELRTAGIEPNFVFRTSDNTTVAAMVRAGIGSAVVPLLASMDHAAGLVIHPLDPAPSERQIFIARPTQRTIPPSTEVFVEITRSVCRRLTASMEASMEASMQTSMDGSMSPEVR